MVLLTLLDFICLLQVVERFFFFSKMSQIIPFLYSPGCCLSNPSSNGDCEAATASRSRVSRSRCCQIHDQLRGPTPFDLFKPFYFNHLTGNARLVPGLLHHPCQRNPVLPNSVSSLGVLEEATGHSHGPGTKSRE